MNPETEEDEIKPLISNYVFHIILFILYLVLHIIIYSELFWIIDTLRIIFIIVSYIDIIYFLFPIFPLIILLKRIYKKKIMNLLRILTLIMLIIGIVFGLISSIVLIINTLKSKLFYKECPFSLSVDHLNATFSQYYENNKNKDEVIDKCNKRRCVLDQVNLDEQYPYVYLCNYEPSEEFEEGDDVTYSRQNLKGEEITANKQLICFSVDSNYSLIEFNHSELYLYLNLCYIYANFYQCKRFNKPEKDYDLPLTEECPENDYLLLLYILCVLAVIMDIVVSLLPWGREYITFKKLVIILSITRRKVNSHNSTAKSSVISQEQPSFKKEKTPIIIIVPEIKNNDFNLNIDDNESELRIKNNIIKINKKGLNNIEEDEKDIYRPNIIDKMKNSERNKLNTRDNEIDIKLKDNIIKIAKDKEHYSRNKSLKLNFQNTTLFSSQVKPLEIKNNNNNT